MMIKTSLLLTVVAVLAGTTWAQSFRGAETYTVAYEGARTTYDWGQHTPPGGNGNNNNHQNGEGDQDGHMWQHRCGGGSWTCAGAAGLCIDMRQMCDGVKNCPGGEDEDATVCRNSLTHQKPNGKPSLPRARPAVVNRFRGQGFMFSVKNLKVVQGSHAKLFNQDSDRNIRH